MQKYLNAPAYVAQRYADVQVPKNTEVAQKDYSINRSKQAAVLCATDIFFYLLSMGNLNPSRACFVRYDMFLSYLLRLR